MRIGNNNKSSASFKKKLTDIFGINSFKELLVARIISPRLNITPEAAKSIGSDLYERMSKIENEEHLYQVANELASIRFGEQFNIPITVSQINRHEENSLNTEELDLRLDKKEIIQLPYGLIAILGGPDAGKTSLINHMQSVMTDFNTVTAMEPITNPDEPFLVGPTSSCLGLVSCLKLKHSLCFYDSARFVRGVSDYGLGEKGLPIGVSLFLTDINNLLVYARKRLFLVVSTESNNESYNQAYYELLRGAVNGIIQPIAGSQAGYIECKPDKRTPILYKYGTGDKFDTVSNIFELKTNFMIKENNND